MTDRQIEELVAKRVEDTTEDTAKRFEREILMKQANMQLLQSQINPHFLYNTLECIKAQAIIEGSEMIADTAQALSLFFRYSISSKSDIVSIREELANIKNYVNIQQFRFRGRFDVFIGDIEDEILLASIPKLSLQPVIENAIIHGLADTMSGGRIDIAMARAVNDCLTITVTDNGKGMDAETLEALCRRVNGRDSGAEQADKRRSVGLWNVNRRIKLLYGEEYGMSIFSTEGRGTTVELFFPLRPVDGAE